MAAAQTPLILFAPGAGAGSDSAWMRAWRQRLGSIAAVEMLDYPYRQAGRKAPDKLPVLVAAHRAALEAARAQHPAAYPVVLAGKSMGGRVGCHVALEAAVDGLVCLGYPLRGTSGALRDEVLVALRTPILFVQGTRDPLCPLEALATVRQRMTAPHELLIVEGGSHSLEVARGRKARGVGAAHPSDPDRGAASPQEQSDARVLAAIAAFVDALGRSDRLAGGARDPGQGAGVGGGGEPK